MPFLPLVVMEWSFLVTKPFEVEDWTLRSGVVDEEEEWIDEEIQGVEMTED